jgi:hypothetical protein
LSLKNVGEYYRSACGELSGVFAKVAMKADWARANLGEELLGEAKFSHFALVGLERLDNVDRVGWVVDVVEEVTLLSR